MKRTNGRQTEGKAMAKDLKFEYGACMAVERDDLDRRGET